MPQRVFKFLDPSKQAIKTYALERAEKEVTYRLQ
jgi:hypothetical protein